MGSVTEEIKARIDIVDLISDYVTLKKAGRNYKALCPFHSEKTPSFFVFPETQTWRCFGACNEGGDIFTFVMKHEGMDFPEALRFLARQAGVELKPSRGRTSAPKEEIERLSELLAEAARWFHHQLLNSPEAAGARAYIAKRGLEQATIQAFMLGYAPRRSRLSAHLRAAGYTTHEMLRAGVLTERDDGTLRDRFFHRLMIPIRDRNGRTVGFGARALEPDQVPKYMNSPQGPLFDKSKLLFGLDMARRTIREQEVAVIVEGYMDVMQAHQAGFTNVVAQMGTALTEPQLRQLSRYADRLILALDPDAAGVSATMRGLEVASQVLEKEKTPVFDPGGVMRWSGRLGVDFRVVVLPEGNDPDDLIRQSPEKWRELVGNARPVVDYVIESALRGKGELTAQEKEQIARQVLPIISAVESHLQRRDNIQKLARALRIDEATLMIWAERQRQLPRRPRRVKEPPKQPKSDKTHGPRREAYILAVLLVHPYLIYRANRRLRELGQPPLSDDDFTLASYRAVFRAFTSALGQDEYDPIDHIHRNTDPWVAEEADALLADFPPDSLPGDEKMALDWTAGVLRLRISALKRRLVEMRYLQEEIEAAGDLTLAADQATIMQQYTRDLGRLQKALSSELAAIRHI